MELTLNEFLRKVLEYNEGLQNAVLEVAVQEKQHEGEKGIFEPELVGSYEHVDNERPNTVEQQRNLLGASLFDEENNIYSAGIEALAPTGARLRLGSSLRDLRNNLQREGARGAGSGTDQEFVSFVGLNLAQPLLRNAGLAATMANIRIAALESDAAFQQYRRRLMELVTRAIASYWELYLAQETVRFHDESVSVAQSLLEDRREAFKVGQASELEVLEARSGLALRRTRRSEARQRLRETANRLVTLYSGEVRQGPSPRLRLRAVDEPEIRSEPISYPDSWRRTYELNPDYLEQRERLELADIELAYAKNQMLPELDLTASYGLNGLGATPSGSFNDLEEGDFPSWSVGFELRFPLGGNIRGRKEVEAGKLRKQQRLLQLKELETDIGNSLDTAIWRVERTAESVTNYQEVVEFYDDSLDSKLQSLEVGAVDSRDVLETEERFFEAREALSESLVEHRRALLEWQLIQGTVLTTRDLDLTKEALLAHMGRDAELRRMEDADYHGYLQELKESYRRRYRSDESRPGETGRRSQNSRAVEVLRKKIEELESQHSENP